MHLLAVVHGIRFDIAKSVHKHRQECPQTSPRVSTNIAKSVHKHFEFNSSFAAFATLDVVIRHKN